MFGIIFGLFSSSVDVCSFSFVFGIVSVHCGVLLGHLWFWGFGRLGRGRFAFVLMAVLIMLLEVFFCYECI